MRRKIICKVALWILVIQFHFYVKIHCVFTCTLFFGSTTPSAQAQTEAEVQGVFRISRGICPRNFTCKISVAHYLVLAFLAMVAFCFFMLKQHIFTKLLYLIIFTRVLIMYV